MGSTAWQRLPLGLALALSLPSLAACSGDYPLPPTRCDQFCSATKSFACEEDYEPAACVVACERNNPMNEACAAPFEASVACLRVAPRSSSFGCRYLPTMSCLPEQTILAECLAPYAAREANR
jgi:hypothetical protein